MDLEIIPDNNKVRIVLTSDGVNFNAFYWFRMRKKDFYWGSSCEGARFEQNLTKIDGNNATIDIPEDFGGFPKGSGKFSYHESGQVHFKSLLEDGTESRNTPTKWEIQDNIIKPTRFQTILGRKLKYYDKPIGNPNKGGFGAIGLQFSPDDLEKRIYTEFYLCPVGTFTMPKPLLLIGGDLGAPITHTLNKSLILVVRFALLLTDDEFHSDKEISIIPNYFEE